MKEIGIEDLEDFKIGHEQDYAAATGCSVIICAKGAVAGVDVRGGAPGTRETDLLNPVNLIQQIHAVILAGGSAFGLDAASGVMKYLEEKEVGFDVGVTRVPIVCSAVLFDLLIGNSKIRPNSEMGYKACIDSERSKLSTNGNIGAGTGATLGKVLGPEFAMKGGLGSYALEVGDLKIGAIVAVNCLGDVVNSKTGEIIAGLLNENKTKFLDTEKIMINQYKQKDNLFNGNTTIGVVITNAKINKAEANKIASMAHNGYGRTIRPAHTSFDGDTIFTMASGKVECDANVIGLLATRVIEEAVIRAVLQAETLHGYIGRNDIKND